MSSLHAVLANPPDAEPIDSLDAWWQRHRAVVDGAPSALPVDQAILGGFAADRVAYAFASGYQAALRALVPDLPADCLASLCVTERGGGHPRAVETSLTAIGPDSYRLSGRKRWATLSSDAGVLLVAASTGTDAAGRNRLRLVRVESTAAGVTLTRMAAPPFTPEVSHAEVELSGVLVHERDLYPGDGFARYVRPFRTIEDVHVTAAVFAYLVREIPPPLPGPLAGGALRRRPGRAARARGGGSPRPRRTWRWPAWSTSSDRSSTSCPGRGPRPNRPRTRGGRTIAWCSPSAAPPGTSAARAPGSG